MAPSLYHKAADKLIDWKPKRINTLGPIVQEATMSEVSILVLVGQE